MNWSSSSFVLATFCLLSAASPVACTDASKGDPPATRAAASGASSVAASAAPALSGSASASAPAAASASLAGDASGVLALSWKVANAGNPRVAVSVVVGDQTLALGSLDATADDSPSGTVEACEMKNLSPTTSRLWCGGTPANNYYTADLKGGAVVITLTKGVDGVPASEKTTEVTRRATSATTLRATGPASPLLSGNCRRGYVQRTPEGVCMRQCLKGQSECKGKDTCTMIGVTGGDGPHKVSACVPPGK